MLPDIMRLARANPNPSGRQYAYTESVSSYAYGASQCDGGIDTFDRSGQARSHTESITGLDGKTLKFGEMESNNRIQASSYHVTSGTANYVDTKDSSKSGYGVA